MKTFFVDTLFAFLIFTLACTASCQSPGLLNADTFKQAHEDLEKIKSETDINFDNAITLCSLNNREQARELIRQLAYCFTDLQENTGLLLEQDVLTRMQQKLHAIADQFAAQNMQEVSRCFQKAAAPLEMKNVLAARQQLKRIIDQLEASELFLSDGGDLAQNTSMLEEAQAMAEAISRPLMETLAQLNWCYKQELRLLKAEIAKKLQSEQNETGQTILSRLNRMALMLEGLNSIEVQRALAQKFIHTAALVKNKDFAQLQEQLNDIEKDIERTMAEQTKQLDAWKTERTHLRKSNGRIKHAAERRRAKTTSIKNMSYLQPEAPITAEELDTAAATIEKNVMFALNPALQSYAQRLANKQPPAERKALEIDLKKAKTIQRKNEQTLTDLVRSKKQELEENPTADPNAIRQSIANATEIANQNYAAAYQQLINRIDAAEEIRLKEQTKKKLKLENKIINMSKDQMLLDTGIIRTVRATNHLLKTQGETLRQMQSGAAALIQPSQRNHKAARPSPYFLPRSNRSPAAAQSLQESLAEFDAELANVYRARQWEAASASSQAVNKMAANPWETRVPAVRAQEELLLDDLNEILLQEGLENIS